jgi:hypothetical protein
MITRLLLDDLETRTSLLWWQERGLSYTRTGYGRKIPTSKMVRLDGCHRWRRVYCTIYSNIGTCWIVVDGEKVVVG